MKGSTKSENKHGIDVKNLFNVKHPGEYHYSYAQKDFFISKCI